MSKDDRRAQLLDAAGALVEAEGPAALTMERLADRAGVSKPVVYDHFANRTQLVLAVLARTWAEIDAEVAIRAAAARTPAERLRATFDALVDTAARQGPNIRGLVDSGSADPEVERARRARWSDKETGWAAGLERDLGLAPATAAAAATTLRAAMVGAVAHARTSPAAQQAAADVYVTTVLATLGALSDRKGGRRP
ncbi:MAG TPA: helix-turn-helix domain-containing protein [Acidimicrobiales bacterium]|nr:helix-turn-helix domain-containing protein [Acidimicrobiales bacterium]